MKTVALGDLCDITVGRTPSRSEPRFWGDGHPWVSIADMTSQRIIRETRERITTVAAEAGKVVSPGTVLLSFKLSIGKVAFAGTPLYTNEAIAALPIRDESRICAPYLARALESQDLTVSSNRAAMGSTLNKAQLQQIGIPLPSLGEQRRIAAILDQGDALRAKRRQVLAHLDALTQSIFYDMFGSLQDRNWRRVPLHSVVPVIENGTSPKCQTRRASDSEWGILKLGAVTSGTFRPQENKAYLSDVSGMTVNEVKIGDVLMTRKNTRELVGAVAIVDDVRPRLLLPDLIFRLRLDTTQINSQYFQSMMMNPMKRQEVQALAGGSAGSMPNISKARLNKLPVELPPLPLQKQYAARVREAAAHRERVERNVVALDRLFESLQSRAFRGEL